MFYGHDFRQCSRASSNCFFRCCCCWSWTNELLEISTFLGCARRESSETILCEWKNLSVLKLEYYRKLLSKFANINKFQKCIVKEWEEWGQKIIKNLSYINLCLKKWLPLLNAKKIVPSIKLLNYQTRFFFLFSFS